MTTKASKPKTTTTRKATSAPGKSIRTAAKAKPMAASKAAETAPVDAEQELRKVELLEKVVERSQIKKKDAKPVVEAMMAILGETLAEGRSINLQPMGKIMTQRQKETPTARISTVRVRQSKRASQARENAAETVKEGVAEPVK